MISDEIIGLFIEELLLLDDDSNAKVVRLYKKYLEQYPCFKKYGFAVATNDITFANFHLSDINTLNKKQFIDAKDDIEIYVHHPYANYENILYLSPELKQIIAVYSNVFVDSNTMNIFENNQNKRNKILDYIVQNSIQINYLPYILEDYVNPFHKGKKQKKTLEKIKYFETVSNIDKKHYFNTKEVRIDKNILIKHGFNSLEDLVKNKFFFFSNFFEKNSALQIICPNKTIFWKTQEKFSFNVNHYLSDYDLFYGFVLYIVVQKWSVLSTYEKIENLYLHMVKQGRILKQLLYLAYRYYEYEKEVNKFLRYDKTWSSVKILKETYNITWDIFLFFKSRDFIGIKTHNNIEFDMSIPFFMTKDHKFYDSFTKDYDYKTVIINNSEGSDSKPFWGVTRPTEQTLELENIIIQVYEQNPLLLSKKEKYHKIFKNPQKLHSFSILFREEMVKKIIEKFD